MNITGGKKVVVKSVYVRRRLGNIELGVRTTSDDGVIYPTNWVRSDLTVDEARELADMLRRSARDVRGVVPAEKKPEAIVA